MLTSYQAKAYKLRSKPVQANQISKLPHSQILLVTRYLSLVTCHLSLKITPQPITPPNIPPQKPTKGSSTKLILQYARIVRHCAKFFSGEFLVTFCGKPRSAHSFLKKQTLMNKK